MTRYSGSDQSCSRIPFDVVHRFRYCSKSGRHTPESVDDLLSDFSGRHAPDFGGRHAPDLLQLLYLQTSLQILCLLAYLTLSFALFDNFL